MKKLWLGVSAGIAAVGMVLLWPGTRATVQEDRAPKPVVIATSAPASPAAGSIQTAVDDMRAQVHPLWRSEPWARGERDELLIEWRTVLASANSAQITRSFSPDELATPFGAAALQAWLEQDSAAASAWIATQPGATDRHAWLVAEVLTRQPQLLAAFCRRLDHGSWAQAFLDYSSRELLSSDPPAAVSLAESMSPGERQTRLLESIACDWMLRDPGAARAWINGVGDPVLRHGMILAGAQSYASIDALDALEWLVAQTPDEDVLVAQIRTIARIGLHTTDQRAVAWLSRLLANGDARTDPVPQAQ